MKTSDPKTGVDLRIRSYIIVETSWLLTQPPPPRNVIPFARRISNRSWEFHAARFLLPLAVKDDLRKLRLQGHDAMEIANAQSWLTYLFGLIERPWKPTCIITDSSGVLEDVYENEVPGLSGEYREMVSGLPLFSCAEIDVLDLPEMEMQEGCIGADSLEARQLITLARIVAGEPFPACCFVCTKDQGIQTEIASLFYKRHLLIGCSSIRKDYTARTYAFLETIAQQDGGAEPASRSDSTTP